MIMTNEEMKAIDDDDDDDNYYIATSSMPWQYPHLSCQAMSFVSSQTADIGSIYASYVACDSSVDI